MSFRSGRPAGDAVPGNARRPRLPAAGARLIPLAVAGSLGLGAVAGVLAGSASARPEPGSRWSPLLRLAYPLLLVTAGAAVAERSADVSGLVRFEGALASAWLVRTLATRVIGGRIAAHSVRNWRTHGPRE